MSIYQAKIHLKPKGKWNNIAENGNLQKQGPECSSTLPTSCSVKDGECWSLYFKNDMKLKIQQT